MKTPALDPKALMAIRDLELRAQIVVEGFWNGLHRSPYHGFSVEFSEYRQYSPGDDPRYLDWKLYGRSDRYYLKKFEDETNLRCHILLDASGSMGFGSLSYTKADYARTLALTLACFLQSQGDAVGLMQFGNEVLNILPARSKRAHLRALAQTMDRPARSTGTNLRAPLQQAATFIKKRGLLLLISDFFTPLEGLEKDLGLLKAAGHEIILLQILDPAEAEFKFTEASRFYDVETEKEFYVDPKAIRERYLTSLKDHIGRLKKIGQTLGISLHQVRTDEPLEWTLSAFLRDRLQRGKKVVRARGSTSGR